MEYTEKKPQIEKAVLVSVDTGDFDAEVSIDELASLAETAGAVVVASVIQRRERPEAATFVGLGKLSEIKTCCEMNDADLLIFDTELSPSQQRNIETLTGVHVRVDCKLSLLNSNILCRVSAARAQSFHVSAAVSVQGAPVKPSSKATGDTSDAEFSTLSRNCSRLKKGARCCVSAEKKTVCRRLPS